MSLTSDNAYELPDLLETAAYALSALVRSRNTLIPELLRLSTDDTAKVIDGRGKIRWTVAEKRTATRSLVATRYPGTNSALVRTPFVEHDRSHAPSVRVQDGIEELWTRKLFFSDRMPTILDTMAAAISDELTEYGFDQIDTQASEVWPPFGTPPISIGSLTIQDVFGISQLPLFRSFPDPSTPRTSPQIWVGPALAKKIQSLEQFWAADRRGDGVSQLILNGRFPYSYGLNWIWSDRDLSHTAGTASGDPLVLTGNVTRTIPVMSVSGSVDGRTLLAGDRFAFAGEVVNRVIVHPDEDLIGQPYTYTAAGGGAFTDVRFDPPVTSTITSGTAVNQFGDMQYSVLHVPAAWKSAQFLYPGSTTYAVSTAIDTGLTPEQPGTGLRMNMVSGSSPDHSDFLDAVWWGGVRVAKSNEVILIRTTT